VALVLVVMAAVEAFGLRNGTLGVIAIAGLAGLAVTLVLIRFNMVNLAVYTTYAAAFTLTWNGWFVGPARPADVLALAALLFFAFAHTGGHLPRLPKWVWQVVIVIVLVLALNIIFRPDATYVANRVVLEAKGLASPLAKKPFLSTNFSVAFKFIVATALVPLAFAFAATYSRHMARRLIILFAVGSAISGWVAILGLYGITTLNRLTGLIAPGAPRQIGMAYQSNYLAAGVVLAVPIGIWLLVERDKFSRLLGLFVTLGCVLGAYASGSRGGAVCVVGAIAVAVVLVPNARKFAVPSFFVAITAVNGIVLLVPSVGTKILKATRLVGASTVTDPSNQARSIVAHQALRDFAFSPIHGIGYQVSFDAQTVYLQELQAGGLLLFVAMLVYNFGAIVTSYRLIPVQPLAGALCASVIASLALDIFEADSTDRFYYVPIAAIVALRYALPAPEPDEPVAPASAERRERAASTVPRQPLGAAR
jgi:O-Antigen ligase